MHYQFAFGLAERDYLEFNKHHMIEGPGAAGSLRALRIFVLIINLLAFCFGVFLYSGDGLAIAIFAFLFAVVSVGWWFAAKPLRKVINAPLIKLSIKLMKKNGKLPYTKNVNMNFYDAHFHEISETGETKVSYSATERILEGQYGVYIYINSVQAYIIPYTAFEDENQKNGFVSFIKEKQAKNVNNAKD